MEKMRLGDGKLAISGGRRTYGRLAMRPRNSGCLAIALGNQQTTATTMSKVSTLTRSALRISKIFDKSRKHLVFLIRGRWLRPDTSFAGS
ncbi:hypothetical protein [Paraburkholderia sp. BCC1884]|uniref:hypothetical protein n=1 Tax=Paraburkholderia sp. BCC1884 TaxID=2562668 RepID=UPI0011827579|nr:hypothetical protein [Paraburkholderia sp. BCC1884]